MSLKEFFLDDKFAALAGCELLDIKPGYATARMKVVPELHNAMACVRAALSSHWRTSRSPRR